MFNEGPRTSNTRTDRALLLAIFLLSGSSGLIYQVVWSRSLVLIFGSTTHAISTVLAAFMGGLALGSILVGRRGDRFSNPLKVYAIIEAAIAVLALAVLLVLPALIPIYRVAWQSAGATPAVLNMLRFLLACLVLLPPTTLMGATLPILSAHLERRGRATGSQAAGSGAGALYAANTVGAVAGAAITGFFLLPALGMFLSAVVAAAANLIAAAAAWRLATRTASHQALPASDAATVQPAPTGVPRAEAPRVDAPRVDAPRAVLLIVFAISGAGALIFEVVWTRVLSLVLGSSTQAFTIMLTTFLAGLALGSALATRLLPRITNAIQAFVLIELGAGLTAFFGIYLFAELPYAFLKLFGAVGDSHFLFSAGRFLLAALVMLPPTLCLGAAFPLAARALLKRGEAVSAPVAALYTSNTVGAIIGSTAAGFILIPFIGLQASLLVGCALNVAAGAVLLAAGRNEKPILRYGLSAALIVSLPGLVTGMPDWNGMVMTAGVYQYAPRYLSQFHSRREFLDFHAAHAQLYYKDGPTTTVTVEKRPERIDGKVNIVLSVNGKVDASSAGDMDTQVLLGQLPMLVADHPRTALVIGLGSGVSAGSALTHSLDKLTIVEIEPAILEAEQFFTAVNGRPLADPRTTVRVNDARNDLLVSDDTYDVIISEPSNPWITGPSKLFTREFFELARSRLNPGGLLCQWVQLYGLDPDALKTLLRTYAAVFPHRMVFKGSMGDLLILGSSQPLALDVDRMTARMREPRVQHDLARVKISTPVDLLVRFRLADADIDQYVRAGGNGTAGPLNTDDNALIEFAAARSLYREDYKANDVELAAFGTTVLPSLVFSDVTGSATSASDLAAGLAARLINAGLIVRAQALVDAATAAMTTDGGTKIQRARLLAVGGDLLSRKGDAAGAYELWLKALAADPVQPRAAIGVASHLMAGGDTAGALKLLESAADDRACLLELARARLLTRDAAGALTAAERLEDPASCSGGETGHDPQTGPFIHLYKGRALAALGRHEEAGHHLRLYFDLFPATPRPAERSIEAATDLAGVCIALADESCAIAQYRVITGLADSLASWNGREAKDAIERKDLPAAAGHLRAALKWNPQDNRLRRLLAQTLNELGGHEEAVATWRDLDNRLEGDEEALHNIAGLSLAMRRPDDAIAAFERLREIEDDPAVITQIDDSIRQIKAGPLRP